MRKVDLRMNEQIKFETIKRAASKEITVKRAAIKLNCTIRTVYNLIKIYLEKGKLGFIHGNRTRKPSTTISHELKSRIIKLYQDTYFDANFYHFKDLLGERETIKISYNALYKILSNAGYISPKCNKITTRNKIKELRKKLEDKTKLTKAEEDYVAITNLQDPYLAHPRKPRAKYQGELIQMDASQHLWFGETKSHLHLAIDDASGQIVGAYFDPQETLHGYYQVLYQILKTRGIPASFLTDRRTVFEYSKLKNPSDEKDTFTQFGYACHQLGIDLNTTSTPQTKGRVERVFGTLQSRLIIELRLEGITCIQEANKFLNSYLKKFNEQFAVPLDYTKSVYDTQITDEKINYTLAIISKRKVDNGNSIKYKKHYYQFYLQDSLVCVNPKTECCVLEAFDGSLIAAIGDEIYEIRELLKNHNHSKMFDSEMMESKPKYKGHKPEDCHPWTYYSYKERQRSKSA